MNFLAPRVIGSITALPLLLFRSGLLPTFQIAAATSGISGVATIFGAGYYLGKLSGRRPLMKAARMSLVARLTFGGLVAPENLL